LLSELKEFCGEQREIHVYRELTKKFEEHIGNNIKQVIDYLEGKEIKGEITIIIKGREKTTQKSKFDEYELKKELNDLITAGLSLSKASAYLAKKNNIAKNKIYNIY
jgi:16S rRNA (cytidine1402-2'-O)-methyltransferase